MFFGNYVECKPLVCNESLSINCEKNNTKVYTPTNYNRSKQCNEPITIIIIAPAIICDMEKSYVQGAIDFATFDSYLIAALRNFTHFVFTFQSMIDDFNKKQEEFVKEKHKRKGIFFIKEP